MVTQRDPPLVRPNTDQRLEYVLGNIIEHGNLLAALMFANAREINQYELVAWHGPIDIVAYLMDHPWLLERFQQLDLFSQAEIHNEGLEYPVVICPMTMMDQVIGVVVLVGNEGRLFDQQQLASCQPEIMLAQTALENIYLAERLITNEAIALTAQAIAHNPSPQNIVEVLRDYLVDEHVSDLIIGLYGPVREGHPDAPIEYIEVRGSWSRKMGSQFGLGARLNLIGQEDIVRQLQEQRYFTTSDLERGPLSRFIRTIVSADHIRSMALLSLHSEHSNLGILAIATDELYEFPYHELRTYQIVAEFLTMSTMAAALQQQASFVQQGRAALLDAVTDGVVMVLPDEVATILTVNEQFSTMFDLDATVVERRSLWQILEKFRVDTMVREHLQDTWSSLASDSPETLRGEFVVETRTGNSIDIQWYSGPVYERGTVIGRIYTFHDITPERAAERLRSELLSRISHELRTPLTSIRGFAEFILEADRDELSATTLEYTEIIKNSAVHLTHIFTDIIDLSRANTGELKLQWSEGDVAQIVRDITRRLEPQIRQRQHRISLSLDEHIPQTRMDVDRTGQVLTNLVSNAIKYSPQGSEITVTATFAQDQAAMPDHAPSDIITPCTVIGVLDQGSGLFEEEATNIFLPFYRTRDARARKVEGAGLGLAISSSIVKLHRGCIWVQPASEHNPGGRFYFSLPVTT